MKILSIGSQFLSRSFRDAGIKLHSIVPSNMVLHPDDIPFDFYSKAEQCSEFICSAIEKFKPDLIFQGDHSGPLIHTGLENYSIPKVWYAVDVHLHYQWYKHYAVIFDQVFCAQKKFVEMMSTYNPNVEWMPLFYSQCKSQFVPWNKREYAISFVGTMDAKKNPERVELFENLKSRGIEVLVTTGKYDNIYSRSKIVINQSVADDLNLRFFEATGCGALLITDGLSHSMNEILEPGEDFLLYEHGNIGDLIDKIKWAEQNDSTAEIMAKRAQEKILKNHLEMHRAIRVLSWFKSKKSGCEQSNSEKTLSHLAWTFDCCSKLDIPETVTDYFGKKAYKYANLVLNRSPDNSIALLLLAEQAFQNGDYQLSSKLMNEIVNVPNDEYFEKRFLLMKATVLFIFGNKEEAIKLISGLIDRYPDDADLQRIDQLFESKR